MTVYGRDASDFDGSVDFTGLGFFTHKVTEGTRVVHTKYGSRLAAARAAGVPVLGSYHVLRTPGSGGNGSLTEQLAFWVSHMDSATPWWRTVPWILQIDAEHWPYDNVPASTVLAFADLLARSGLPGYPVTYASRGQYGDALRGIATPLWNADYRGSAAGSYPGDAWTVYKTQPAGWAPYSGRVPMFLQYTDSPYDKDAFPGSLPSLLALVSGSASKGGNGMQWNSTPPAPVGTRSPDTLLVDLWSGEQLDSSAYAPGSKTARQVQLDRIEAAAKAAGGVTQDQVDAAVAKVMNDPAWLANLAGLLTTSNQTLTVAVNQLTTRIAAAGRALDTPGT